MAVGTKTFWWTGCWSVWALWQKSWKIPFFLASPLIPFWSEPPVYDGNIMADIDCILWVGCSIIKSDRYDLSYNRNFYMVFKATITIEWNGWRQPSYSMVLRWFIGPRTIALDGFDGCPPSVKRCDAMDHRSSLVKYLKPLEAINCPFYSLDQRIVMYRQWAITSHNTWMYWKRGQNSLLVWPSANSLSVLFLQTHLDRWKRIKD